ncbi:MULTISPECIES: hypothetical protein [Pyrococcus]|nr:MULTISPECIES: hypothetical protein [Pyrococcus]MDK2869039.1 hypothetical protein [Pyrococcus sp.]
MKDDVLKDIKVKTIVTYVPVECPVIEDVIYQASDIVIETKVLGNRRVGIFSKGGEGIFPLFEEG